MDALGDSLLQLWFAILNLVATIGEVLEPWWPLILGLGAWVVFWLFAVNWTRLWEVLFSGGMIGLLLIGAMAILVWGVVAPPERGYHYLLGLEVSNFVGKFVYVAALVTIMFLCASAQMSGALPACCRFGHEDERLETFVVETDPGAHHH